MALVKTFSNTIAESKKQEKEITKLSVLDEKDKNTIYNLLFTENPVPKDKE